MTARYRLLLDKFVGPLQRRAREMAKSRRHPLAVAVVRKEMVPVAELPALLGRLSRVSDESSSLVLFDGATPNDGLIFTPDRFDLIAGSRMDQFKWKWTDALSVDWVVRPMERVPPNVARPYWADTSAPVSTNPNSGRSCSLLYCEMYWFFRRRAARNRPDEQDTFGHSFAGHGWLYNPDHLPIEPQFLRSVSGFHQQRANSNPQQKTGLIAQAQNRDIASEGGTVVECSLVPLSAAACAVPGHGLAINNSFVGVWRAERVRRDKNSANAVTAVLSVVESVAENLGVVELLEQLAPNSDPRQVLDESLFAAVNNNNNNNNNRSDSNHPALHRHRVVDMVMPPSQQQQQQQAATAPSVAVPRPQITAATLSSHELASSVFLICVVADSGLKLLRTQWRIKIPGQRPLVCNHKDLSECVAPYDPQHGEGLSSSPSAVVADAAAAAVSGKEDGGGGSRNAGGVGVLSGTRLEGILTLALANDGGCIGWSETSVRTHYDPQLGRYVIEQILPEETKVRDNAYCNQILKHLLFVIGTRTFYRPQPQQQPQQQPPRIQIIPPFVHPTVPIRDTSLAQNTSRHYDEIANHFSNRSGGEGGGGATASAAAAAAAAAACAPTKGKGIHERSALRKHQNWIKQVLLSRALEERGLGTTPAGEKVKATLLDLCSGRGGDLLKYSHAPLKFLTMIDASFDSSVEAARRYCNTDGLSLRTNQRGVEPGIRATFAVADCFDDAAVSSIVAQQVARYPNVFGVPASFQQMIRQQQLQHAPTNVFDLVSCQFSLHYSCSSEARFRGFLRAVASSLTVGGVFFGTTVDERVLAARRREHGDKFGNDAYSVEFVPEEQARRMTYDEDVRAGRAPLLSEGYLMHMAECVQGALEYVVPFERLVGIAIEEGLVLVEEANFADFFLAHRNSPLGRGAFAGARMGGSRRGRDAGEKGRGGNEEALNDDGDHDAAAAATATAAEAVPITVDFGLSDDEKAAAFLYRIVLLRKFR